MDSSLSIQNDASDSNGGIFNTTKQVNSVVCLLSTITKVIPPELFIDIFKTIPPEDLFSVAQVCKLFNDVLSSNQQIWRTSRLAYWPHLPLPPPVGMNEQSYIKLAMLEKGCQFCHKRKIGLRVYWAFQVRCCKDCLLDVTISDSGLWSEVAADDSCEIQPNIYSLLPYVNIGGPLKETRYWTADVKAALLSYETPEEYLANVTDALNIEKFRIFMEDAETRTATDNEAYLLITKSRRSRIESIIDDFSNQLDEEGVQIYSTGVLTKCPAYTKEINLFDQPFTHKDERLFKEKLTSEHEILTIEIATKERRSDILHALWDLVPQPEGCTIDCENPKHFWKKRREIEIENENPPPYLIPTTDAIFDAIEWCPSFNNPPFKDHDPRNSWEKEFLYYYLIPKIRTEADEVRKKMCIFPYWTVKGAARHRILSQARVFRCRLCYDHTRRFDYRNVDVHLQSCIHSLKTLDTDEIAEVDVMRALREICNVK